jgi:hypothetical protein
MTGTRQYDPTQVILNVGGHDVVGYADGSFIEVERYVDAVETKVGSDGEVTRVLSANRSGFIKVILQQSSPLNDYFSSLATQDELSKNGVVPTLLKDANGTTIVQATKSWIKKKAKTGFETSSVTREWTIDTGVLDYTLGGVTEL